METGKLAVGQASGSTGLARPEQLVGYRGDAPAPSAILLRHNGLHIELLIDRTHPIGRDDAAGLADVVMESAVTTIMDCEDSVAAVDAPATLTVYRSTLAPPNATLSPTP